MTINHELDTFGADPRCRCAGDRVRVVQRLMDPRPVAFGQATVVAVVGLAMNIVSAFLLGGGHHHGHGHDHHDHDHDNGGELAVPAIAITICGRLLSMCSPTR